MKPTTCYQLVAFLLQYPSEEMVAAIPEVENEMQLVSDEAIYRPLQDFISNVTTISLEEWVNQYVEQFDFGKKTNLYVTYFKMGEQKERGLELLKLKQFYEAAGFQMTEKELPDYIPLMLEFSAHVSQAIRKVLWMSHEQAIWEIKDKLLHTNSVYLSLFNLLIYLLEQDGIVHQQKTENQPPIPNLEDQAILASMRDQLIKNQLG